MLDSVKTHIARIVILASALTLGACASSTPRYVAADDATDYGHYTRKISEDRYRVNFNGDRHTNLQEARDFTLLRAAEITMSEGYDWFQIVDRETSTTEKPQPSMEFDYEHSYTTYRSCGLISCSESVRPTTWQRTRLDSTRTKSVHTHSIEIVLGKGEMPEDGHYYDATDVIKTLFMQM